MTLWLRILTIALLLVLIVGLIFTEVKIINVEDQQTDDHKIIARIDKQQKSDHKLLSRIDKQQKEDHMLLCYIADSTGVDSPSDGSKQLCAKITF